MKRFGQVIPGIYRSSAPDEDDWPSLQHQFGILTVLNLAPEVEDCAPEGITVYTALALPDKQRPYDGFARDFLSFIASAPRNVLVHCKGGRHRTGCAIAILRISRGWTFDQAYKEMKQYGFYSWFGHGVFKDYVKDYADGKLTGR